MHSKFLPLNHTFQKEIWTYTGQSVIKSEIKLIMNVCTTHKYECKWMQTLSYFSFKDTGESATFLLSSMLQSRSFDDRTHTLWRSFECFASSFIGRLTDVSLCCGCCSNMRRCQQRWFTSSKHRILFPVSCWPPHLHIYIYIHNTWSTTRLWPVAMIASICYANKRFAFACFCRLGAIGERGRRRVTAGWAEHRRLNSVCYG